MNTAKTSSGEKQDLFNKIMIVAMLLAVLGCFVGVFHLHSIVQEQKKQALEAWDSAWARYAGTAVTVEQKKVVAYLKNSCDQKFWFDDPKNQERNMKLCLTKEIDTLVVQSMTREDLAKHIPKAP